MDQFQKIENDYTIDGKADDCYGDIMNQESGAESSPDDQSLEYTTASEQNASAGESVPSSDEESIKQLINIAMGVVKSPDTNKDDSKIECDKCGHMRGFTNKKPCCGYCVRWYVSPIVCTTCDQEFMLSSSYQQHLHSENHAISNHSITCAHCRDHCFSCLQSKGKVS